MALSVAGARLMNRYEFAGETHIPLSLKLVVDARVNCGHCSTTLPLCLNLATSVSNPGGRGFKSPDGSSICLLLILFISILPTSAVGGVVHARELAAPDLKWSLRVRNLTGDQKAKQGGQGRGGEVAGRIQHEVGWVEVATGHEYLVQLVEQRG